MTYKTYTRVTLTALLLSSVGIVSVPAQNATIEAQPLASPAGSAPAKAATPAPAPTTPAPTTGGYVTGDSSPTTDGPAGPQPLDGGAMPSGPAAATPETPIPPNRTSEEQNLLNRADVTLKYLRGNHDYVEVDQYLAKAKAVFILPQLVEAAFFIGGKGGEGVMLARLPDNTWSAPSFTDLGGVSFGLQAGAKSSEMIFFVMTDKGLDAILTRDVKLGADISVALVTVGKGVGAGTAIDTNADVYAVAKADGLFGGAALDGSVISPNDDDNAAFYGQKIAARDILNGRIAPPAGAQPLVEDLR